MKEEEKKCPACQFNFTTEGGVCQKCMPKTNSVFVKQLINKIGKFAQHVDKAHEAMKKALEKVDHIEAYKRFRVWRDATMLMLALQEQLMELCAKTQEMEKSGALKKKGFQFPSDSFSKK